MRQASVALCVLAVVAAALAGPAAAGTRSDSGTGAGTSPADHATVGVAPPSGDGGILSEVRVGVLRHDHGFYHTRREPGTDVNLEVLMRSPGWTPFKVLRSPRPHVGTSLNLDGKTSQLYGGFTWEWRPFRGFFVDGSLGLSLHDGHLGPVEHGRAALGLRVLFRESIEVGYRFNTRHGFSAILDHISNAGLGSDNDGITNLGIRYGYRF